MKWYDPIVEAHIIGIGRGICPHCGRDNNRPVDKRDGCHLHKDTRRNIIGCALCVEKK